MPRLKIVRFTLSLFLILMFAVPVTAHQLSVFAWVEGDTVLVEGRLPKGKHPKLGEVLVFDGKDQPQCCINSMEIDS